MLLPRAGSIQTLKLILCALLAVPIPWPDPDLERHGLGFDSTAWTSPELQPTPVLHACHPNSSRSPREWLLVADDSENPGELVGFRSSSLPAISGTDEWLTLVPAPMVIPPPGLSADHSGRNELRHVPLRC